MSLRGTYLVLYLDGEPVAEAADISLKVRASTIEATTQTDGQNARFIPGSVKIGMAGTFFTSSANWDLIYGFMKEGSELGAVLYQNEDELFDGGCVVRKLGKSARISDSLVAGTFSLRYYPTTITAGGFTLLTESCVEITTETDVEITTE